MDRVGARERRYAEAIWNASRADEGAISATGANFVARAVLELVDAEVAGLNDRLWKLDGHWREVADRHWNDSDQPTGQAVSRALNKAAHELREAVVPHVGGCDDEGCYCPDDVAWGRTLGPDDPCAPGKDWVAAAFGEMD